MNYLKNKQHYIDRYDLATINECLDMLDICTKAYIEGKKNGINKGLTSAGEWAKASNWLSNQMLYQIIGNRFRLKEETFSKWINVSKINTIPPRNPVIFFVPNAEKPCRLA